MDATHDRVDPGHGTAGAGPHTHSDARDLAAAAGAVPREGDGDPAGPSTAPPIERWVAGRRVTIATIVSLVATVVPSATLALLGASFESDATILAMLAISGVAAVLGTWAAVRWPRPTTWAAVGVRRASRGWFALGAALGAATMLLNSGMVYLYGTLTGDRSIPVERLAMVEVLGGPLWQSLVMLALGAVLVPLGEELIFRGVVFGWLRRWPLPVAVLVSALIFAVMHGFSVVFPVALVLGVVTALVYHHSGSIWPAVVLHMVNNGIAFGVTMLLQ